jgi:hypothetical protein
MLDTCACCSTVGKYLSATNFVLAGIVGYSRVDCIKVTVNGASKNKIPNEALQPVLLDDE